MSVVNNFGITDHNSVFADIEKYNKRSFPTTGLPKNNADTFEKQAPVEEKSNKKKNLIRMGIAFGAIAICAIAFRKNIAGAFKALSKTKTKTKTQPQPPKALPAGQEPKTAQSILNDLLKSAKQFMIDDLHDIGEPGANGICFYGPNSVAKETTFESFIQKLSDAGYTIKRVPRIQDSNIDTIKKTISEFMDDAENLFKKSKKRTIIVIRDLDKIAPNREVCIENNITSTLLRTQGYRDKGFSIISEAVHAHKIDPAVSRFGRTEHQVICRPSLSDSKKIWEEYKEIITNVLSEKNINPKTKIKFETLLKDAIETIKEL